MSTGSFHFARSLKISRFAIDVLIQRLERLELGRPEGDGQVIGETNQCVRDCDHLHHDLCNRFIGMQSFDGGSIVSLMAAFEVLNRRIIQSISDCNAFESGSSVHVVKI
jgi:hypothetical protein